PFVTLATLAWFTALNGAAIARRTGKSRARQMLEQLHLAATRDVLPPWYYIFELFDDAARRRAAEYLHRFETKAGLFRFVKRNPAGRRTPLADRLGFARSCREHGIATAPVLLAAERGEPVPGFGGGAPLPAIDLFVKPMSGRGGSGATRWRFEGNGRYRDGLG